MTRFFKPGSDRVSANAEDAPQSSDGVGLLVSRQGRGFGFLIVSGAACILASVFVATAALVTQFAFLGMTIAGEMFTATVGTTWDGCKHKLIFALRPI